MITARIPVSGIPAATAPFQPDARISLADLVMERASQYGLRKESRARETRTSGSTRGEGGAGSLSLLMSRTPSAPLRAGTTGARVAEVVNMGIRAHAGGDHGVA